MKKTSALVLAAVFGHVCATHAFTIIGDTNTLRIVHDDTSLLIFNQNGTAIVTQDGTLDILLVVGGGGGGAISTSDTKRGGGGGGGGGVVYKESVRVTAGTYPIVVGAGGGIGKNGGDTTAFQRTAYGGGAGAGHNGASPADGASGGGATHAWEGTATNPGGNAIYGAEDNLGQNGGSSSHVYGAGGGGGAGGPAKPHPEKKASYPGSGGDGAACTILGEGMYYGGGGAGYRSDISSSGGIGGGGSSVKTGNNAATPMAGTDGLGGGGAGGAPGGHGVVILRFKPAHPAPTDTADFRLSGSPESIAREDETIHLFRQSGTLTVTGTGTVELLVVGGGGGGGGGHANHTTGCGGGGGGGVVHYENFLVYPGTYAVNIGAGGAVGEPGGDTLALGVCAFGGGAGASSGGAKGGNGATGGGGASNSSSHTFDGGLPLYTSWNVHGYQGGTSTHMYGGGGGGGAGAAGRNNGENGIEGENEAWPGSGGDGLACSITGKTVWYGGGGAGTRGDWNRETSEKARKIVGGKGGGGDFGLPGTDGLGGGGSGNCPGGSGIVIIRYRKAEWQDTCENATGGTFVKRGRYGLHTFTQDGTFTLPHATKVDVFLVGGGGGGGENHTNESLCGGGGGGGGGVVYTNLYLGHGPHALTVGAGGAIGQNGGATTAFGLTAYGGGHGAKYVFTSQPLLGRVGGDGASGGGATHCYEISEDPSARVAVAGGLALYVAENNLGNAGGSSSHVYAAGGGGGAGAPGGASNNTTPGAGGDGVQCPFDNVWYAGGGAGFRADRVVNGGKGGGGASGSQPTPGTDGLGGGGSGGARGGSGIILVRYRLPIDGTLILFR